jgi:hypothetical protein
MISGIFSTSKPFRCGISSVSGAADPLFRISKEINKLNKEKNCYF